ncbi:hypothetical protein L1887_21124 [Cichorium endivia]|nr:hypothetical protein L1887_21124 [Cichorium endivia]
MNLSSLLHFVIYFLLKPNETVFGLLQKLNFNPTSTSSVETQITQTRSQEHQTSKAKFHNLPQFIFVDRDHLIGHSLPATSLVKQKSNTSTKGDIYNFDILVLADGLHRLKRYLKGDTTTTFTSSLGVSSLTMAYEVFDYWILYGDFSIEVTTTVISPFVLADKRAWKFTRIDVRTTLELIIPHLFKSLDYLGMHLDLFGTKSRNFPTLRSVHKCKVEFLFL